MIRLKADDKADSVLRPPVESIKPVVLLQICRTVIWGAAYLYVLINTKNVSTVHAVSIGDSARIIFRDLK